MRLSRRARSRRASTGAAPLLETATITGSRSTMDGRMNEHSAGWSTTFTGMCRALAATATARFTASSPVAAMASATPVQVLVAELRRAMLDAARRQIGAEGRAQFRREHRHARAGAQQQRGLARRDLAAAHHQAGLPPDVQENG